MNEVAPNIDFGLLNRMTDLVVCSRCFQAGRRNPVVQVISARHRPRSLCRHCSPQTRHHKSGTLRMLDA